MTLLFESYWLSISKWPSCQQNTIPLAKTERFLSSPGSKLLRSPFHDSTSRIARISVFAAVLTRRAYLPCGSVLYSVRRGCRGEALARLPLLFISGRSVSRLYQTVWIAVPRVYRVTSDPCYNCMRTYIRALAFLRASLRDAYRYSARTEVSMRISRRESIRLPCSRDSARNIERGAARGILRVLRVIREYHRHILKHLNSQR